MNYDHRVMHRIPIHPHKNKCHLLKGIEININQQLSDEGRIRVAEPCHFHLTPALEPCIFFAAPAPIATYLPAS